MRDYDDLYKSMNGQAGWQRTISAEAGEWLDGLVAHIQERGREPVWVAVHARFAELFPGEAPKVPGTLTTAVRKRLG